MEAREIGAEMKALGLVSEYIKKFRFIHFTMHPSDIPGEAPGKSSNTAWAARKASERYPLNQRRDVIVTGIDGMFISPFIQLRNSVTDMSLKPIAICLPTTSL
jgi:hypothetical protein